MSDFPAAVSVRVDEPLKGHLAWRTGGTCAAFVVVPTEEHLAETLSACRSRRWSVTVLGAGTRTLVRDGGLGGAVLRLGGTLARWEGAGETWTVGAMAPVSAVVFAAAAAARTGLERWAAVPGSMGASWLLDDGWDPTVTSVRYFHRRVREGTLAEARAAGGILVSATLRLEAGDRAAITKRTSAALAGGSPGWFEGEKRSEVRTWLRPWSDGDVRLRKVAVPRAAPDLLVNLGSGTAQDLSLLHKSLVDRIHRERGVELRSGLRWAGTP